MVCAAIRQAVSKPSVSWAYSACCAFSRRADSSLRTRAWNMPCSNDDASNDGGACRACGKCADQGIINSQPIDRGIQILIAESERKRGQIGRSTGALAARPLPKRREIRSQCAPDAGPSLRQD
jgi:hypothetical protein